MITAEQIDFNTPPEAEYDWVQTILFPVIVPEENIYALIYSAARPVLGVVANQVVIYGALTDTKAEMLHLYDNQHLPPPLKKRSRQQVTKSTVQKPDPAGGQVGENEASQTSVNHQAMTTVAWQQ